jgi:hypothetical protein
METAFKPEIGYAFSYGQQSHNIMISNALFEAPQFDKQLYPKAFVDFENMPRPPPIVPSSAKYRAEAAAVLPSYMR